MPSLIFEVNYIPKACTCDFSRLLLSGDKGHSISHRLILEITNGCLNIRFHKCSKFNKGNKWNILAKFKRLRCITLQFKIVCFTLEVAKHFTILDSVNTQQNKN
jgi:hypothetical protein